MKPKTKVQVQVVALSKKLPKITREHKNWAYAKHFKFYALTTKHTANCFECGHQWKQESTLVTRLVPFECPKCHKELVPAESRSWSKVDFGYFQVISVFAGFQVIEAFEVRHSCKKGRKAQYDCFKLYQHWISPKGKLVILSILCGSSYSNSGYWKWGTDMEVRQDLDKYYVTNAPVYLGRKILPVIRRNGFKGNNYCGLNATSLFRLLLSEPRCETLIKASQTRLVGVYNRYGFFESNYDYDRNKTVRSISLIQKYWPSIRICIRNNYKIMDPSMWFDQLAMLEEFGKDIYSPKFICPKDLHADHQVLIKKKEELEKAKKLDKLRSQIEKSNETYRKAKEKYFGINFTEDALSVVVLDHVREFYEEGLAMHHCVFTNKYWNKPDTLCLSARKGEERLETVEISLKTGKILQCRGKLNKDSSYHTKIINLVNSNISTIRKAAKVKKIA